MLNKKIIKTSLKFRLGQSNTVSPIISGSFFKDFECILKNSRVVESEELMKLIIV